MKTRSTNISSQCKNAGSSAYHNSKGTHEQRWAAGKGAIDRQFKHSTKLVWKKGQPFSYSQYFESTEKKAKPHDARRDELGISDKRVRLFFSPRQRPGQLKDDYLESEAEVDDAPVSPALVKEHDICEEMDADTYESYLDFLHDFAERESGPLADVGSGKVVIKVLKDKDNNFRFKEIFLKAKRRLKVFLRKDVEDGVDVSVFNTNDFKANHPFYPQSKKKQLQEELDELKNRISCTSDREARLRLWKKAIGKHNKLQGIKGWENRMRNEEPKKIEDIDLFFESLHNEWRRKRVPKPNYARSRRGGRYKGGTGTLPPGYITSGDVHDLIFGKYNQGLESTSREV